MTFQFAELLTLGLCVATAVYLLTNRRRIRALRGLRPFVAPFLLLAVAWTATVLEGIPGGAPASITFVEKSTEVLHAGPISQILNLIEHLGYMVASVWLLVVLWRAFRSPRGAAS
jgi:hypothetical protein